MRKISDQTNGFTVYAVSGTNTVSFGIDYDGDIPKELGAKNFMGFSVFRKKTSNGSTDQGRYMPNMKVFKAKVPNPSPTGRYTTEDHPVQHFLWDDFTTEPGEEYTYTFFPRFGNDPKNLKKGDGIEVKIETEALHNPNSDHSVFFNRGAASSQAYSRKFPGVPVKNPQTPAEKAPWEWLTRDLEPQLLAFINSAVKGDIVRACFYEFRYQKVAEALKNLIDQKGVDVKIIYDSKGKQITTKDSETGEEVSQDPFPKTENDKLIEAVGLRKYVIRRTANINNISHNKFIVVKRASGTSEVWTGSTNISDGGIFGQTNVGHWVRNDKVANAYLDYWNLLKNDPGKPENDKARGSQENEKFKQDVAAINKRLLPKNFVFNPENIASIPNGTWPVFSPMPDVTLLQTYAGMVDTALNNACITLAFGVGKDFKDQLVNNSSKDQVTFMLLEKKDEVSARAKDPSTFVYLNSTNNVYKAYGAKLPSEFEQFLKEIDTGNGGIGVNAHVKYIHSKFLLMDPLSSNPVVVTGSANFSSASTKDNDENMLVIKGDLRVADIYFTEFMRLFMHYYFRSVYKDVSDWNKNHTNDTDKRLSSNDLAFLKTDGSWLQKFKSNSFGRKRISVFASLNKPAEPRVYTNTATKTTAKTAVKKTSTKKKTTVKKKNAKKAATKKKAIKKAPVKKKSASKVSVKKKAVKKAAAKTKGTKRPAAKNK